MKKNRPKLLTPQQLEELRPYLFRPCTSKEELHNWILVVLGYDLPDATIDPTSNSNPMALVWELYEVILNGGSSEYSQVLAYAAREGIKTLGASILEVLCLLHHRLDIAHMAAIKVQSLKSQTYVKRMLNRPLLREFVTSKNDSTLEITRYLHYKTGANITLKAFEELDPSLKDEYEEIKNSVVIVVATVESANGQHTPITVVDEADIIRSRDAYEEAKMIASESETGGLPLTLITSTRKYSFGIVQDEIDNADESNLKIRHWNIIDVTKKCAPERHLPNEPEIPIYYSEELLRAIPKSEFDLLDSETQKKYSVEKGSPGCLKNCKLYAACRGRLKNQTSDSRMLKSIDHVQNAFRKVSLQRAKAQLMCWKPSSEGLIYPYFSKETHMLTAAQIANRITGEDFPEVFAKADLIKLLKERGNRFTGGMDFGSTHCFAICYGFKEGNTYYMLGGKEVPDLEPTQQIDLCKPIHEELRVSWYPDTAMPGIIKMFRKFGFSMHEWKKTPGSVLEGIDVVRSLIMPAGGAPPRLYLLKGDEGTELLAQRIMQYHWKLGANGKPTNIPDEEDDDLLDACRYDLMNQFTSGAKIIASISSGPVITTAVNPGAPKLQQQSYLTGLIDEALGRPRDGGDLVVNPDKSGGKGKLHWSF